MPSPFPGMDPYLENPDFWQGFHNTFMTYARDALHAVLPDNYVATVEMRIYYESAGLEGHPAVRVPDLEVVRTGPGAPAAAGPRPDEVPLAGQLIDLDPVEHREAHIAIRWIPEGRLVTSIELPSPSNKRSGEGRDQYRVKQSDLVTAGVNLLEIDLLRRGAHTVLPPAHRLAELPPFHYLASIYRATDPLRCQVFTWTVREPLPAIPVPLTAGEREVDLELRRPFDTAYDSGRFGRMLVYAAEAEPPLAGEDAAWADRLLRDAGLRGEESA